MNNQDLAEKLKPIFERHGVVLAYLFGSQARGTVGPLSDVDIAVVFDQSLSRDEYFDRELKLSGDISRALDTAHVDVVDVGARNNPALRYEAVLGGKLIYSISPPLKTALERVSLREYEDTKFLRETSYRILVEQIKTGAFGRVKPHHAA